MVQSNDGLHEMPTNEDSKENHYYHGLEKNRSSSN